MDIDGHKTVPRERMRSFKVITCYELSKCSLIQRRSGHNRIFCLIGASYKLALLNAMRTPEM